MQPILQVQDLSIQFGGLLAVDNFHLKVAKTELRGIIGPNGAGKTTVFNMLTGVYTPTKGEIRLAGTKINGLPSYKIVPLGMARTFQNIRLFKDLSVLDNVRLAGHYRSHHGILSTILRSKKFHDEEEKCLREAREILKIFQLHDLEQTKASNLPYGKQRRLEMARALMARPKVLLLDEPAAGMNPNETNDLTTLIRWIRDQFQIAIVLIEHDMKLVMNLCEQITVLDHGQIIAEGLPKTIQHNPKVIEAYLGAEAEALHL